MADDRHIVLYHCPNTRSSGALTLLEELKADYELKVMNMKAGEHRQPAYLAVNPMGKVPAITHNGALITEQGAIFTYLGDLYADRGLAPQMGDPLRGPYLRWMFFYGSAFEPAVVDKAMKHEGGNKGMLPYGDYDTTLKTVEDQLSRGPYILGDKFTVADVLWGAAMGWTTMFGIVTATPTIKAYIERTSSRPAAVKVRELDGATAAKQQA